MNYVPLATGVILPTTSTGQSLGPYLERMFEIGISVAAALAVIMIIVGGIQYMSSDAIGGKEEGKERITSAIWGLLLALVSFLILNTINPNLVSTSITIPLSQDQNVASPSATTPDVPSYVIDQNTVQYIYPGDPSYPYSTTDKRYGAPVPTTGTGVPSPVTGSAADLQNGGTISGLATNFGYNDPEDNGRGTPLLDPSHSGGVVTNDPNVMGVAIPASVLEQVLGVPPINSNTTFSSWAPARNAAVEISSGSGAPVYVPIVDVGPGSGPQSKGVVVDETYGLYQKLGGNGAKTASNPSGDQNITYRIVPNYYSGR